MTARVLVVDDLVPNIKLLEAKLTSEYFQVVTATDGATALKLIEDQLPDIVLLDVMMPEMNGFEVCRRIKQNPHSMHVPRSEEHTSELQSLMRISYAVFCLKKKNKNVQIQLTPNTQLKQQK